MVVRVTDGSAGGGRQRLPEAIRHRLLGGREPGAVDQGVGAAQRHRDSVADRSQAVCLAGLTPAVRSSDRRVRHGHITKLVYRDGSLCLLGLL
jgi:hypothetical protein